MIESIGAVADNTTQVNQNATVSQEDLFEILLTQLSFQDPLEPIDNQEFIAQIAQFTNLEQTRQVNEQLESLLTLQAADQSLGLLGKTVEAVTEEARIVGTISTILFEDGSPLLTLVTDDNRFINGLSLSQIQIVR